MIGMGLRKVFDTIDHPALMHVLRSKGLPDEYVSLLFLLYENQVGSVNRSSIFAIQQGVKPGDTLSAILFNSVPALKSVPALESVPALKSVPALPAARAIGF